MSVVDPEAVSTAHRYDFVVANILANPLIALADRLTHLANVGGRIVLSGLLTEQADAVRAAYGGTRFVEQVDREEWSMLVAVRDE